MEGKQEEQKNISEEKTEQKQEMLRHVSHSYQDDLAQAMNATDASVVQQLLETARDREESERIAIKNNAKRKAYTVFSILFLFIALAVGGYGIYHYTHLTVPVTEKLSVGVFPSTDIVPANTTNISDVVQSLITDPNLKPDTPYLVPIVDNTTNTLLTNQELFRFMESDVSEPFAAIFDSVRLGVMRVENTGVPFIIGAVRDPVVTTKEFLIAEPELLSLFAKALGIDTGTIPAQIGTTFTQTYRYNLPVRILTYTDQNGQQQELFFYGFATNNIVVITTNAKVLETISSNIIRQQ